MTTLALIADPWRYTVLALASLGLGVAVGVTTTSWSAARRYLWANLGVAILQLSIVATTIAHLRTGTNPGVYVEVVGEAVYLAGNALLHERFRFSAWSRL